MTPVTGVRRRIATDELPTAPPRVVIVEDDDDARWMLRLVLEAKGLHVIAEAPDGPAAVTAILEGHPDLALVDLSLPGFDGLEIARRVRALGSPTRLVALTGHGDAETRRAAHDAGFDAHLVKPLDAPGLAMIRRLLCDRPPTS
ncbi:MAG: response regulator [Myxococcales bacterium]|nr:response regulator [Myxococcales bacterium]